MPLRDHFHRPDGRPPNWDQVHGFWPSELIRRLNRSLPAGFRAASLIHITGRELDVVALENEDVPAVSGGGGGTAALPLAAPALEVDTDPPDQDEYSLRVYEANTGERLVASVEFVSPGEQGPPRIPPHVRRQVRRAAEPRGVRVHRGRGDGQTLQPVRRPARLLGTRRPADGRPAGAAHLRRHPPQTGGVSAVEAATLVAPARRGSTLADPAVVANGQHSTCHSTSNPPTSRRVKLCDCRSKSPSPHRRRCSQLRQRPPQHRRVGRRLLLRPLHPHRRRPPAVGRRQLGRPDRHEPGRGSPRPTAGRRTPSRPG